jgi:hypothetical protein
VLTKVIVELETVQIPSVAEVTATVKAELEVGETEKVPLPKTLVPGFVKEIACGTLEIVPHLNPILSKTLPVCPESPTANMPTGQVMVSL